LKELRLFDRALISLNQAITLAPRYAEAYNNLAIVLTELKLFEKALQNCDKSIELKPDFEDAYLNRGVVLQGLKRLNESVLSYEQAIKLRRDYAEAIVNRGYILRELKRFDEALLSFFQVLELKPYYDYLFGDFLHAKMHICDWHEFESNIIKLKQRISEGNKSSSSFCVLTFADSLSIQRKASEIWINDKHPFDKSLGSIFKSSRKEKIKIGYYSADFREHPVSYLTAEFFELHSKNNFELIAFYSESPDSSNMHKRVSSAFDKFIDIRFISDQDVAQLSRDIGIDIAVDLTGMTANERAGIFSYRAAPIQLSYIGYLGTMGAEYYDYLIADKTIIPADSQDYYSEKIIYLPSYQVNDSKRVISEKNFTRAELNLPEVGFVFCCFNNTYKITPHTFDGWMRILAAVPHSVLFLYADNKWAEENLKMEAQKRGVSQIRLVFGARIDRSDYLARYRVADLFLDTLPYNAGTTASDALWAGLPVLTCMGKTFCSRVAASLLSAIELPELITTTQVQYEAAAVELATNPTKLKAIKDKLERNRLTTALFDTSSFTKNIEDAYTQIYERYQTDLPPDHIYTIC
jgi:predicted O-linked N-acetylglucosamine transferase (SPINDLY family)